ncbi:MAG: hypothetical protein O2815_07560 [Actinomycetota bacterium]|nr:hypothetical protein [Actinomycetota bacterium]
MLLSVVMMMMMMMLCVDTGLYEDLFVLTLVLYSLTRSHSASPVSIARYGVLLLCSGLVMHVVPFVEAVCPICGDPFNSVHDKKENCPQIIVPLKNQEMIAERSLDKVPTLHGLLPPEVLAVFNKWVVEAIVGIVCAPSQGSTIDFDASAYASAASVVRAAVSGHCSVEEAGLVLMSRLEVATESIAVQKITAAIELLKSSNAKLGASTIVQQGQGVFWYIWGKIGQVIENAASGTVKLVSESSSKGSSTDLSVKVRHPKNESEFFYMLHLFIRIVTALGITSFFVVHQFVSDVVHARKFELDLTWQLCYGLFSSYVEAVDRDGSRTLTLANVYQRGSGDTYLVAARRKVETFFRTRGGDPQPEGGKFDDKEVKWNGEFNKDAKKPCVAWNLGKPHNPSSLDATGRCKFNHFCMQWVDDKGPSGMCHGDHPKCKCTYDSVHKLTAALK